MQPPMMVRGLISIVLFGLMGNAQGQLPKAGSGSIVRIASFASQYVTARHVDVWLPDGYSGKKKYAVLYMHDGQMLYDPDINWNKQSWDVDETMGRLTAAGKIGDCIVVGVWNGGATRHADYLPQKPFETLPVAYRDSLVAKGMRNSETRLFSGPVQSDGYLRFLVTELKPYIDSAFSTYPDAAHTFIAGSSMGGLISLYALCEYPEVFGGAACLSTHWPGIFTMDNNLLPAAFLNYLNSNLPPAKKHKLYFDYGTATLDSLYPPLQRQADAIMQQHRYQANKHWITKAFPGEDHSENAWRRRLEIPLLFLLKK
jgi:enterochelin esterase-like enzyme